MKTRVQNASADSYDRVSIAFHWFTALLLAAVFTLALAPGVLKGSIALHGTLGVLLLVIVPLRALWRIIKRGAVHHAEDSWLTQFAAACVHGLMYLLLIAVPLLGLTYVDAKSIDFRPFGVQLPELVRWDRDLAESVYFWKKWLSYGLLALIFLHAMAAVAYHHLFRKDRVLASMFRTPARKGHVAEPDMTGSAVVPCALEAAFARRSFLLPNGRGLPSP
jgi:cytochrome b561